ncbi:MAG: TetR/AcrR family transcriptional regulator [Bacteroidota bacterium]|jgi:AcrR family transcriptional regulator
MEPKDKILKASFELFSRYGIKSVTMDDIAKYLTMSKKTIYQYFRDKNEVVHQLMQKEIEHDIKDFSRIATESKNVVDEIFAHMKQMHQMLATINPNMFYDLKKYHPQSWGLFQQFKNDFILGQVKTSLKRGVEQGLVRKDINIEVVSRLRMEEIDLGFNPEVYPYDKFRIIDVQLSLAEHFLYGVCTLKGHKLINKHRQIIEEE